MHRMPLLPMVVIALSILVFSGCKTKVPKDTENVFEKASKDDSLSYYFPSVLNDTIDRGDPDFQDFKQKWYSSSLYSFKEPVLYSKSDAQTIYRLLWLRSFHQPVCFTMKQYNGEYFFNAKTLDKQPSFYLTINTSRDETGQEINDTTGKADRLAFIIFDSIKILTKSEWKQIEKYLDEFNFWEGPAPDPNDQHSTDGANWIIEARKGNRYHFIDRRNDNGELNNFGKYLIKLSGLKIKNNEIY